MELTYHSPEEQIFEPLFEKYGVEVFVKRDDCIHPFISGNKWRKLKYVLKKAKDEHKTHLITFGGAYSNHLLATACAAAKFGFRASAFVRGELVSNPVLNLCNLFGMELIFTSREDYRNKQNLFEQKYGNDKQSFFIAEGGYSPEAAKGCEEIATELELRYQHIFCAAGTGATAAGLITGFKTHDSEAIVHVVPALKGASFLKDDINFLINGEASFRFYNDYHFGGYAKSTPELIDFIKKFASTHGILLDQVYTGKMMFALYDLIQKNEFKRGSKILAIHTGGLSGLLGLKDFHAVSLENNR